MTLTLESAQAECDGSLAAMGFISHEWLARRQSETASLSTAGHQAPAQDHECEWAEFVPLHDGDAQ